MTTERWTVRRVIAVVVVSARWRYKGSKNSLVLFRNESYSEWTSWFLRGERESVQGLKVADERKMQMS